MIARLPPKSRKSLTERNTRIDRFTRNFSESDEYIRVRSIACGTFGAVFEVRDMNGERFALKKVVQNPHYKNRELDVLNRLAHPNCMRVLKSFYRREGIPEQTYLHIVSELFPMDLAGFLKSNRRPPICLSRIFAFQIFRGLAYLQSIGICHRDIKTTNILVNPATGRLQICDFGSAKPMLSREPCVSYIATRRYRAPELLFDCTNYCFPIDIWAAGCVIAELFNDGHTLFKGGSNADLLVDIARYIGPPSDADVREYGTGKAFAGKRDPPIGLEKAFAGRVAEDVLDLLQGIFVYSPRTRITATECMEHQFFESVRRGRETLPNGSLFVLDEAD
jgi:glycogen synthase kinase 3 beta